jgi:hypothetical protein
MLRRRWPVFALAAWSAFVWGTRISNAWNDATATTATKVGATVLSLSVLALAVASVAVVVRARRRSLRSGERRVVQVFAGWTAIVWIVRAVEITFADYSANPAITNSTGFKIVHVVLGAISIALAALSWQDRRGRPTEPSSSGPGRTERARSPPSPAGPAAPDQVAWRHPPTAALSAARSCGEPAGGTVRMYPSRPQFARTEGAR